MNKVPCGGFELGDSLVINDGKLDLVGGAGSVTVDSELSDTSTNPVQNKVVKAALDAKLDAFIVTFTVDDAENIISDKTFDEISEAYKAGNKVSAVLVNGPNDYIEFHLSAASEERFDFFMLATPNGKLMYSVIQIFRSNQIISHIGSLTVEAS